MKELMKVFVLKGMVACGFGPLILAVVYLILRQQAGIETLTVNQVCMGIFTLTALAFIAGGMNVIYQVERLPLMMAIFIHGVVLYGSYMVTYLVNGWLEWGITPILVFTGIFIAGYLAIWAIIYTVNKRKTDRLNKMLEKKQHLQL